MVLIVRKMRKSPEGSITTGDWLTYPVRKDSCQRKGHDQLANVLLSCLNARSLRSLDSASYQAGAHTFGAVPRWMQTNSIAVHAGVQPGP